MTYKKMWEELKDYIHNNYNGENEIEYVMEELENIHFKKEDVIDELIKEVNK